MIKTCRDFGVDRDISHVDCECEDGLIYSEFYLECVMPSECECYFQNKAFAAGPREHLLSYTGKFLLVE